MYEVKIAAEFTTGTTHTDQKQAEQDTQRIFLELLKKNDVALPGSGGIFMVRIVRVESQKL